MLLTVTSKLGILAAVATLFFNAVLKSNVIASAWVIPLMDCVTVKIVILRILGATVGALVAMVGPMVGIDDMGVAVRKDGEVDRVISEPPANVTAASDKAKIELEPILIEVLAKIVP